MKRRIAIVHSHLRSGGGSEARALRLAEVLSSEFEVSLITMGELNPALLESAYGVRLGASAIRFIVLPFSRLLGERFDALKSYPLGRYCRRHAKDYDLMISAYNVMDFGRPGLQFVADFSFEDRLRRRFHPVRHGARRLLYGASPLRTAYLALARRMAGGSRRGWRRNITVANSAWSRDVLAEYFGVEAEVLYPPVENGFPRVPWADREEGFVVLGRIDPAKKLDSAVRIVQALRESGRDIHLHFVGRIDDAGYAQHIRELCEGTGGWARLQGPLYGHAKKTFLGQHKYGLSCIKHEAFGIAVAELVKAGCLVWVPDGGGQIEIVRPPELRYASEHEAVGRISSLLDSPERIQALLRTTAERAADFSIEAFQSGAIRLVKEILDRSTSA